MEHSDSFHSSFRILFIFAQVCGLLPLKGIYGCQKKFLCVGTKVTFTWANPIHLYGLFITVVTIFFNYCYTADNLNTKFGIDVYASTVFYTVCLLTTFLFFRIAMEFSEISDEFEAVDTQMADYGYPKRLGLKIKIFIFIFVILAVVEHGTLVCINVANVWHDSAKTGEPFAPLFYANRFNSIEQRVSYSMLRLLIFFWANIICTFNWNYLDFFLICLSMEVYERFSQINHKLKQTQLNETNPAFFGKINEDYNSLSLLTKKLDRKFGTIILTSFFSNLYHLSLQLVRSLKLEGSFFHRIYFYFSLSYLISRLLLVLFFASKIHDEGKKPREILFSVTELPNEGIRFLHQVLTDDVAFTGKKFFIIDRKCVMTVVGTILTYQAFLLQFNSLNQDVGATTHHN